MEEYLGQDCTDLFSNVAVLVYVLDVASDSPDDLVQFEACVTTLRTNSPEANLFILFHKSDLLSGSPTSQLKEREGELKRKALPTLAHCFITTIWDESLYRAWSAVISSLVPNLPLLHSELSRFVDRSKAEEAILFESGTLLTLGHTSKRHHPDSRRFEKISNMLKQLRATTKKFNATTAALSLSLEDGTGLMVEQLGPEAILLLVVPGASEQRMQELPGEIASFRSVFMAVCEAKPEVDPHLL